MLMLFICGFADNISVIVRHTLVQLLTPDSMRGRVSSVNNLFIGTSNELGGFESGLVSQYSSPVFSVVSGGVATFGGRCGGGLDLAGNPALRTPGSTGAGRAGARAAQFRRCLDSARPST